MPSQNIYLWWKNRICRHLLFNWIVLSPLSQNWFWTLFEISFRSTLVLPKKKIISPCANSKPVLSKIINLKIIFPKIGDLNLHKFFLQKISLTEAPRSSHILLFLNLPKPREKFKRDILWKTFASYSKLVFQFSILIWEGYQGLFKNYLFENFNTVWRVSTLFTNSSEGFSPKIF